MAPASPDATFETLILPHLSAAYNLARWLTANEHDAEDLVQEAFLRAFRAFAQFRGGDGRVWLLTIVRNTCYTWLRRERGGEKPEVFDEEIHSAGEETGDPEELMLKNADSQLLQRALEELPAEFREAIVLRELEGLSYKEIASLAGIPVGTVMSRLARARGRLKQQLTSPRRKELDRGLPGK